MWRVVEAGLFTLHELETTASYSDFVQAHRYLDIKARVESTEYERAKREARK